jgi:hypothetical protein
MGIRIISGRKFLVACSVLDSNCKPWRFLWNYLIFGLVYRPFLERKFSTIFRGRIFPVFRQKGKETPTERLPMHKATLPLWTQRFRTALNGVQHVEWFHYSFYWRRTAPVPENLCLNFYLKKGKMNNAQRLQSSKCDTPASESYRIVLVSSPSSSCVDHRYLGTYTVNKVSYSACALTQQAGLLGDVFRRTIYHLG